ncbi:MAG: lysine--tRNA ligase, partial [Clostridia bacterium]|nr:lysine--tRNA ligase [Clostridia bacterium]
MADKNVVNTPEMTQKELSEQNRIRLEKLQGLVEAGKDPYVLTKFDRTHLSTEVIENYAELEGKVVAVAGRMIGRHIMG